MWWIIGIIAWIACGIFAWGWHYAYQENDWQTQAEKIEFEGSWLFSAVWSLFGPIYLVSEFGVNFYYHIEWGNKMWYGWRLW